MGDSKRRKASLGNAYWDGQQKRKSKLPDLGEIVWNMVQDQPLRYTFLTQSNAIQVTQQGSLSTVTLIPISFNMRLTEKGGRIPMIFSQAIATIECPSSIMSAQRLSVQIQSIEGVELFANKSAKFIANNGDVVIPFHIVP